MRRIRQRRVDLGGTRSRALEVEGDGPPLLLLHGFADSADTWRAVLALLGQRGRRAVALDLPGFGAAGRLEREQPILPQLDRFVAAAVRDATVADVAAGGTAARGREEAAGDGGAAARGVVVVGNSLGGCLAMRAAQDRELPVAGIVPIAPAGLQMARWLAIIEGERIVRALLRSPVPLPEPVVREAVARVYRTLTFARPGVVDEAVVRMFTSHIRTRRDVVRILATGRRLLPELREPFELPAIRCPVHMIWGEADRMVLTAGAERVLRDVPGARMEVFERCGHCPQIEAPGRLVELLVSFPSAPGGPRGARDGRPNGRRAGNRQTV